MVITDPEHIAISKSKGITIDWKDGHASTYGLDYLRSSTALPFEDETFDAVFCHAVLYHQSHAMLTRTLAEAIASSVCS